MNTNDDLERMADALMDGADKVLLGGIRARRLLAGIIAFGQRVRDDERAAAGVWEMAARLTAVYRGDAPADTPEEYRKRQAEAVTALLDKIAELESAQNSKACASEQNTQEISGLAAIQAEREKQIAKGWTLEHDDNHPYGELAEQARCCLQSYMNGVGGYHPVFGDEWQLGRKHNRDPLRLLVIAGALIAAEIDRINYCPTGKEGEK